MGRPPPRLLWMPEPRRSVRALVNLQSGARLKTARIEASGPLRAGFLGQARQSLLRHRSLAQRKREFRDPGQLAQAPRKIAGTELVVLRPGHRAVPLDDMGQ